MSRFSTIGNMGKELQQCQKCCILGLSQNDCTLNTILPDLKNPTASVLDKVASWVGLHCDEGLVEDGRLGQ